VAQNLLSHIAHTTPKLKYPGLQAQVGIAPLLSPETHYVQVVKLVHYKQGC